MRIAFQADLDELRLQVEVMALRVGMAVEKAIEVLLTGDNGVAVQVLSDDDEIDAMLVSLSTRCYDLLAQQNPVASDLRLVVSVLRLLTEFERVGDLSLRIAKLAPEQALLASNLQTFGILTAMAAETRALYSCAVDAWATQDGALAESLARRDDALDAHYAELAVAILAIDGPGAVPLAISTVTAGRTLERIADHAVLIGIRIRYLLTGDSRLLADEAR